MTNCLHSRVRCLNHYDTFRKYHCDECGGTYICACERELVLAFLPHQVYFAQEYETQKRFAVTGFAPKICEECRGEQATPHPLAAIWGLKGKVERFYWREIFKTECNLISSWLKVNNESVEDIIEFQQRFPKESKDIGLQAKKHWQQLHRSNPKYILSERTEAEFLSSIKVPINKIHAPYIQVPKGEQKIGKWITNNERELSAEDFVCEFYEKQGYDILRCERTLISSWVGSFLVDTIQDPSDPYQQLCMRHSTPDWRTNNRNTPMISFLLPQDFGSKAYFERRKKSFEKDFVKMGKAGNLVELFRSLAGRSLSLRDYLWVNSDKAVNTALKALTFLPASFVLQSVKWAIGDFWQRQPGWPDLLIFRAPEFRFVEVKSPHDELSQDQMNWFQWAISDVSVPCEIVRLYKK